MAKKTIVRAICITVMALIFAAVLAGNIVASHFSDLITEYFHGAGISYEGEEVENALAFSDQLCQEITEEGVILLKNNKKDDVPTLPLTESEMEKINIFGWSASDGGWIFGSDGSANSNSGTSRAKVKMLTDASGYYSEPLKFYLTAGEHKIQLMIAPRRIVEEKIGQKQDGRSDP